MRASNSATRHPLLGRPKKLKRRTAGAFICSNQSPKKKCFGYQGHPRWLDRQRSASAVGAFYGRGDGARYRKHNRWGA